jgi:predicted transcriptional regulator
MWTGCYSLSTRIDNRSRILRLVATHPGIHLRELQRALGISFNSIRYNTEKLSESGEIVCEKTKGYSRFYPPGLATEDRVVYSMIQNKTTLKILQNLCETPLVSNKELTEKTGFAKSTVSEHVHELLSAGIVRLTLSDQGNFKVELQNKARVLSILRAAELFSKENGIVDSYTKLWDF